MRNLAMMTRVLILLLLCFVPEFRAGRLKRSATSAGLLLHVYILLALSCARLKAYNRYKHNPLII